MAMSSERRLCDIASPAWLSELSPLDLNVTDEIWIDVGAHFGEKTLESALQKPGLRVYAFEPMPESAARIADCLPNYTVLPIAIAEHDGFAAFHVNAFEAASSLLPFNPLGLSQWKGGEVLKVVETRQVPTLRLDTFLNKAGIPRVDFLKIDAQGSDLAVVRSAGTRLRDIARIHLEVQTAPLPLYEGSAAKQAVVAYLQNAGFSLQSTQRQSHDQEENLVFARID
jgi:FkbM family methyltransferase